MAKEQEPPKHVDQNGQYITYLSDISLSSRDLNQAFRDEQRILRKRKILSYTYRDSTVLCNSLGITLNSSLNRFETKLTSHRIELVQSMLMDIPQETLLSMETLCTIHRQLFNPVYPLFAGTPWRVDIKKNFGLNFFEYTPYAEVVPKATNIFIEMQSDPRLTGMSGVDAFIDAFADHYTKLYNVHTFREGNTRSLGLLFGEVARRAGYSCHLLELETTEKKHGHFYASHHAMSQKQPDIFAAWLKEQHIIEEGPSHKFLQNIKPLRSNVIEKRWQDIFSQEQFQQTVDQYGLVESSPKRRSSILPSSMQEKLFATATRNSVEGLGLF